MAEDNKDKDNVEIEPLSDAEMEGVAGGVSISPVDGDSGSSNGCCTCSGSNCSLTEPDDPTTATAG